jgi:hypothetical protein
MARKKTTKKTPPRRRKRMGAMGGKTDFNQLLMVVAGAVGANVLQKVVPDTIAGVDMAKYKAAIPVVIGVVLPMAVKSPWAKSVGLGMVAGGGASFLQDAGIIGAMYDAAPMISAFEREPDYLTNGDRAPMISGCYAG